jgi:hypothetical protein
MLKHRFEQGRIDMRELDCPCGLTLTGADDNELFVRGREHADEHHPDDGISDAYIREHVAANGRDTVVA